MSVFEGVMNLTISIIGVQKIGVNGIFIGTIISSLLVGMIVETYVLYQYGFDKQLFKFWLKHLKYLSTFLLMLGSVKCSNAILRLEMVSYRDIFVDVIICTVICNTINFLIWNGSSEYRACKQYIRRWILFGKCREKKKCP